MRVIQGIAIRFVVVDSGWLDFEATDCVVRTQLLLCMPLLLPRTSTRIRGPALEFFIGTRYGASVSRALPNPRCQGKINTERLYLK
ncbi:hypothetical protein DL93DRAFT_2074118 [Clavulina sp. PMI_390]|nr:hypothetical protein DL93DRAFT_2074118 [Clavulina sp. PMI_390]